MKNKATFQTSLSISGWPIVIEGTEKGLCAIRLGASKKNPSAPPSKPAWFDQAVKQLEEYFQGKRKSFKLPLAISSASDFQQRVWSACSEVPFGRVTSYGQLAKKIGSPKSARAVGQALGKNPVPIVIPCHRVVGQDGKLTGFSAGMKWKKRLLALEETFTSPPLEGGD